MQLAIKSDVNYMIFYAIDTYFLLAENIQIMKTHIVLVPTTNIDQSHVVLDCIDS